MSLATDLKDAAAYARPLQNPDFHRHLGDLALLAIPLVDPMTAVVLGDEYRVSHPCGGGDRCPECGSEHFLLCPVRSKRGDS